MVSDPTRGSQKQEEVVMTLRLVSQEAHCFLVDIEKKFIRHECD